MAKLGYSKTSASIGLFIVAIGLILLLDQMGIVSAGYVFRFFWPAVFIFFGIEIAVCRENPSRLLVGVLLLAFGLFLLLGSFGVLHVGLETLWPILLIIWGFWVIGRAFGRGPSWKLSGNNPAGNFPNPGGSPGGSPGGDNPAGKFVNPTGSNPTGGFGSSAGNRFGADFADQVKSRIRSGLDAWTGNSGDAEFDYVAIFGGVKQRIAVKNFRGGRLFAICGGWDIDLTRCDIEGQTAVIEANALMGGGEIRVPDSWIVEIRGVPLFGGYSDETHQMISDSATAKRLLIKGIACMGGVVIKN